MSSPKVFRQIRFEAPPGATELLLVRHGESEAVVAGEPMPMCEGHGDPPLSSLGREQAELVGARLAHESIDAIYITTLQRTAQTAAPLATRLSLEPRVERDLREVYLGEWESGLFRQKVMERDPIAVRMAEEQRWDVIPGAEPADAFAARVRGSIERIAAAHPDQRVVIVAHGGTIGEILHLASGCQPFAMSGADNGSISHLVVTPQRWIVRRYNDATHLDERFSVAPSPLS
jgi:probable phosphoglycerate mutase